MKAKRVTLLLFVTVISLLTMFLVVLLDDKVLAGSGSEDQLLPNLNLYQMEPQGMVAAYQPQADDYYFGVNPNPWKWCDDASI